MSAPGSGPPFTPACSLPHEESAACSFWTDFISTQTAVSLLSNSSATQERGSREGAPTPHNDEIQSEQVLGRAGPPCGCHQQVSGSAAYKAALKGCDEGGPCSLESQGSGQQALVLGALGFSPSRDPHQGLGPCSAP